MSEIASRVAARHLQSAKKPTDIVVPVTAQTSTRGANPHAHEVFIRPSTYQHKLGQPIVVIDNTGGQWYADDFLKGRGPLYIDFGQGWVLDNADEVRDAVRKILKKDQGEVSGLGFVSPEIVRFAKNLVQAVVDGDEMHVRRWVREIVAALEPVVGSLEGPQVQADLRQLRERLRS